MNNLHPKSLFRFVLRPTLDMAELGSTFVTDARINGFTPFSCFSPMAALDAGVHADVAAHAEGGITPSQQVLRQAKTVTNLGGVRDAGGGAASHLPSNHTESTHKFRASIRAEPFMQTRGNGQSSVKTLCDLPMLDFGNRIASLRFISAVAEDLRFEQQPEKYDISEKDCFLHFAPLTSVSLSE